MEAQIDEIASIAHWIGTERRQPFIYHPAWSTLSDCPDEIGERTAERFQ